MSVPAPDDQLLNRILADLQTSIPGFEARNVTTSLTILHFATSCVAAYGAHFARYGLSQGRFATLMVLYHLPDQRWTPATLAQTCRVRRATMTGLLNVLEGDDWIVRRPNPVDRRSNEIALTDDGRTRLEALLPDHFARLSAAMAGLSDTDHRTLFTLMDKFGASIASLAPTDPDEISKETRS